MEKDWVLKIIEEEITKYDAIANEAANGNDYETEIAAKDKSLVLGNLKCRIMEEIEQEEGIYELSKEIGHKLAECSTTPIINLRTRKNNWMNEYHPKFYLVVLILALLSLIFAIVVLILKGLW